MLVKEPIDGRPRSCQHYVMFLYTLLPRAEAFSAGAAFWIVAEPTASDAGALLDWRLGFQIARASYRAQPILSDALLKIVLQSDYAPPIIEASIDAPLMVEASGRLPCRAAVVIPFMGDVALWARNCRLQWENLGEPTTRVFLPRDAAAPAFQAAWNVKKPGKAADSGSSSESLQLVIDAEFASFARGM